MTDIAYIKLSDLTRKVEEVLQQSIGAMFYWIVAEVTGHKFYPNQDRHYFELVEKTEEKGEPIAKVRAVSWFEGSQHIKVFEKLTGQVFTTGLQVLIKVKVEFHSAYGLSLVLTDIDASYTIGNIEKQRRATLLKLANDNPEFIRKEGEEFITKNKGLLFNRVIQSIAVIGSPNSEGYVDFTHTINNNQFGYKFSIDVYHSSVQGLDAESELISRLIAIYETKKAYDCVVIIRGGGAKTDFLVFDSYALARAVAKFPIPIITGIGHHKDVSIVDLMVKTSTKTPTKAAEFIVSYNRELEDALLKIQNDIVIKSQQLLSAASKRLNLVNLIVVTKTRSYLNQYKENLGNFNQVIVNNTKTVIYNRQTNLVALLNQILSKPKIIAAQKNSELNNLIGNIKVYTNKYLQNKTGYLGHFVSVVKIMSPANVLKKGFAIISKDGKILNNAGSIEVGNNLTIIMDATELKANIISKKNKDETESIL